MALPIPSSRETSFTALVSQLQAPTLPDAAKGYVLSQMACTMKLATLPDKFVSSAGINVQFPVDKAWQHLTLCDRISALVRCMGFEACHNALPAWYSAASTEKAELWLATLRVYQTRLSKFTDGVIATPLLSRYNVLQSAICAEILHLMHLEGNHNQTSVIMDSDKTEEITTFNALKQTYQALIELFASIDLWIVDNCQQEISALVAKWEMVFISLGSYKSSLLSKVEDPMQRPRLQRVNKMMEMLELFDAAIKSPLSFLPILVGPIQYESKDRGMTNMNQRLNLDPEIVKWLEQFLEVCRTNSSLFIEFLRKEQKLGDLKSKIVPFEGSMKAHWARAEAINRALIATFREFQAFQMLPAHSQVAQQHRLKEFDGALLRLFREQLEQDEESLIWKKKAKDLLNKLPVTEKILMPSLMLRSLLSLPSRFYCDLVNSVLSSCHNKRMMLLEIYESLPQQIPAPYLTLNSSYATGVDLLDLKFRSEFLALLQEANGPELKFLFLEGLCLLQWFREPFIRNKRDVVDKQMAPRVETAVEYCIRLEQLTQAHPRLTSLKELARFLVKLTLCDHWPKMLMDAPHKSRQATPKLEKAFFQELFSVTKRSFLIFDVKIVLNYYQKLFEEPSILEIPELHQSLTQEAQEIYQLYQQFQAKVKALALQDDLEFCHELARTMSLVEEHAEACMQLCEEYAEKYPERAESFAKISHEIFYPDSVWTLFLVSALQGGIRYLIAEEMERSPQVVKKQQTPLKTTFSPQKVPPISPVTPMLRPKAAPTPAAGTQPATIEELYERLSSTCQALLLRHTGYTAINSPTAALDLQHQTQSLHTLASTLCSLQELMRTVEVVGERPCFVWELYLRLAVLYEQTATFPCNASNLSFRGVLQHNPLALFSHLVTHQSQLAAFDLTKKPNDLVHKLSRVIAVSSRYPASGRDSLTKQLYTLIQLDKNEANQPLKEKLRARYRQESQKMLQSGMQTCLTALSTLLDTTPPPEVEIPFSQLAATALAISLDPAPKEDVESILLDLRNSIKLIDWLRLVPAKRTLQSCEDADCDLDRMRTINCALRDLAVIIDLAEDAFSLPDDPALCLTIAHTCLKLEAVSLELVLLIQLAHLPFPSPEDAQKHYLFSDKKPTSLRYSHRIDLFAKELPNALKLVDAGYDPEMLQRTMQRSCDLQPYLSLSYRYDGCQQTIEQFKSLSQLWNRYTQGALQPNEIAYLEEKCQKPLFSFVQSAMQNSCKLPLGRTLRLVAYWLKLYYTIVGQ